MILDLKKYSLRRIPALLPGMALLFLIAAASICTPAQEADLTVKKLPSHYSLVEEGKKPKVRSQGRTGTCWAISSVSAIESDLLPQRKMLFSADHMSLSNGFAITQEDGGDYYMIMSYLSDWKGPVLEEEDPYGDGVSPSDLSAAVHVQEIRLLRDLPRNAVKRMILRYGAAQSSLCLNRERTDTDEYHYYNAATSAYFDPLLENLDHDILILGWDDTFSRENFLIMPPQDGAWICQNTWGESFGEDGIFYVSYEDRNLFRNGGVVYSRIENVDNYDHVYENDVLGWQGRQGYGEDGEEGCWFAGAFTAGGSAAGGNAESEGDASAVSETAESEADAHHAHSGEELAAVGLYSTGPGTECRVYVIPQFNGKKDLEQAYQIAEEESEPAAGELAARELAAGEPAAREPAACAVFDTAGFFTVDLDQPVPL